MWLLHLSATNNRIEYAEVNENYKFIAINPDHNLLK